MKILVNCSLPFALAHGGQQIQIERTQAALHSLGLQVEPLRWWDHEQTGDVIHYFGRIPAVQVELAHQKGIKIVMAELLGGTGSRSPGKLRLQRLITRIMQRTLPPSMLLTFNWKSYPLADACVALTPWEAHLMSYIFGARPEKVHVVPNGVEEIFLNSPRAERGPWLVCTATITKVKRVVEVAEAAIQAQTPLWIIGKPYAESDRYAQKFIALARQHSRIIRYEGAIQDRARLARVYREARGFVLLSAWESLSLSALEAAACESPLLLSDLPWARTVFGKGAAFCPITSPARTAAFLRRFYDATPGMPPPPKPLTWIEVARQLEQIYHSVLDRRS
jgi:glycosyltransferase involved in cell wall biosynthesis